MDQPESQLDPLIHELSRLRICAALFATTAIESRTLKEVAGLSDSALSKHLKRLTEADYVVQHARASERPGRPPTWVSLTELGRSAFEAHLAALQEIARSQLPSIPAEGGL